MNVYQCWYFGLRGYCCRNHNSRWMFVPELGQISNAIHKQISLEDLVFNNEFAKEYELKLEENLKRIRSNPLHFIKALLFPVKKMGTVEGMLFSAI